MAEPGDAVREDDVEDSSDEEEDEESSTDSEEESDEDESDEDESDEEEEDEDYDDDDDDDDDNDINVWDEAGSNEQTEEAVEASLQNEYTRALHLVLDGEEKEAVSLMETLLKHPLFKQFEMNIDFFDWEEAARKADENQLRVSAMAQLFASLNYHIGSLRLNPIRYILAALTVYPNDELLWRKLGDESMKICDWPMAVFAYGHCSPKLGITRNILIAMYNGNMFEECLLKLSSVLHQNRYHLLGRVLKNEISSSASYWGKKCQEIFSEHPSIARNKGTDIMFKVTERQRRIIMDEVKNVGKPTKRAEVVADPVVVDLAECTSLTEVGVYFCDLYDRIEAFSSFVDQKITILGQKTLNEFEEAALLVMNDMLDCIDTVTALIDEVDATIVKQPVVCGRKRKHLDSGGLDWRRRSIRFRAEFSVNDSCSQKESQIAILLEESCALELSIIPLKSICPVPSRAIACSKTLHSVFGNVDERELLRRFIIHITEKFDAKDHRVYELLKKYLFWMSDNCFMFRVTQAMKEVLLGCYYRYCSFHGTPPMIYADEKIHVMIAELKCEEAIYICMRQCTATLSADLCARMLWVIAVNGTGIFPIEVCQNRLWLLLDLFERSQVQQYKSLIEKHEIISAATVKALLDQIERQASLRNIQKLFNERHFEKVVFGIVNNFNWKAANRENLMSTAFMLIDSYIALDDMDNATLWISRLLNFTDGLAGTEQVIARLKQVDVQKASLENVSNLVHCIVPLLLSCDFGKDLSLWLILYKAACFLEGEHTVESIIVLYGSGCHLLTSALNILVAAHEATFHHGNCSQDNYKFPVFILHEFSRVRSLKVISEVLACGMYTEQAKAFMDEVYQCLFCLFGCPSRRKRQLEEHGGPHDYEPTCADIECVLSLLLPEKIPPYDASVSFDLIEIVQKKAGVYLELTSEELRKLNEMNESIGLSKISMDWPRCSQSSALRYGVFYQLALYAYRNQKFDDALHYAKLFLITAPADLEKEAFFWDWTVLAFASTSALFMDSEEQIFDHFDCSVFSFHMALFFDPTDRYVIFNFGSALYQISSRIRRYKEKLPIDDIQYHCASRRLVGLLEESRKQFESCIKRLIDGDVDKWRCHYYLAKIAEKMDYSIEKVFYHHLESARQLEIAGVLYPLRINTKKQEHAEPIEIHYRAYACLVKYLLEIDRSWSREELTLMHAFAVCFRSHGVSRLNVGELCEENLQIRAILEDIIYKITLNDDEVSNCLSDITEVITLQSEVLDFCEEAFSLCVQRFPHFKSFYRLTQLQLYKGNVKEAANCLFGRFLTRKKANYNSDNIFESVVTMSCKDIDRGDALQFHLARITALAINLCTKLEDVEMLTTLLHTLCTLHFCNNVDFLLKKDLIRLYHRALMALKICIVRKAAKSSIDSHLLINLYDLYQYSERNQEQRLCKHLSGILRYAVENYAAYACTIDPVIFCKHLHAVSKRKLGKRKFSSTSSLMQSKVPNVAVGS